MGAPREIPLSARCCLHLRATNVQCCATCLPDSHGAGQRVSSPHARSDGKSQPRVWLCSVPKPPGHTQVQHKKYFATECHRPAKAEGRWKVHCLQDGCARCAKNPVAYSGGRKAECGWAKLEMLDNMSILHPLADHVVQSANVLCALMHKECGAPLFQLAQPTFKRQGCKVAPQYPLSCSCTLL